MKKSGWSNIKRSSKEDRTSSDGILHASKAEMARWNQLLTLQAAGRIRNLCRQVSYKLERDDIKILTPTGMVMKYRPDFVYDRPPGDSIGFYPQSFIHPDGWFEVIEDHKGWQDKAGEMRIAVFEGLHKKKVHIHR